MRNNHYISKFLTQRWRQSGSPLWHYDFARKKFSEKYSVDRLFAKRNLWPDQIEDFLQENTENFSPRFIQNLESSAQPEWNEYKALFLLILFQSARVIHAHGGVSNLKEISVFSPTKLEQLVLAARETKVLCGFRLPADLRFFFPETGIFPFPIDQGGFFEWMFALPITGSFCVGLVPKTVNLSLLPGQINYEHLVAWSVGTSKACNRVVIHPDLYTYKNNTDDFQKKILQCRSFTDTQAGLINQLHSLL